MPLTDFTQSSIISLLPRQFGMQNDTNFVSYITDMATIFLTYANFPVLYFLLCKRAAIEYLLGNHWQEFNTRTGPIVRQEQDIFKNLLQLKKDVDDAIKVANQQQSALLGVQIDKISATYPEVYNFWGGPNSILFRGMPYPWLPDGNDATI